LNAKVTFFPVDNGDMTLIKLPDANSTTLLIDCNIRKSADNPDDPAPDVAKSLRSKIGTDSNNRPYVDAMLLSHPDEDHCRGIENHFWLGAINDYPDDDKDQKEKRIVIRQIWSSPMVFRRASIYHILSKDAKAFNKEVKRRVKRFKEDPSGVENGDKVIILGEDENGKTDNLSQILIKRGGEIHGINSQALGYISAQLLAPLSKQDDMAEEEITKNNSSVIMRFTIRNTENSKYKGHFLTGGDAGVYIWEKMWELYKPEELEYSLLLAPHHCSWRSLSYESWSDNGEGAKISDDARNALGQAKYGALIVSSSKPIADEDSDPPCIRAKRVYKEIVAKCDGSFKCTGESPSKVNPAPLNIEWKGASFVVAIASSAAAAAAEIAPPRAGSI
jgi:hypothetical protein